MEKLVPGIKQMKWTIYSGALKRRNSNGFGNKWTEKGVDSFTAAPKRLMADAMN